MLPKLIVQLFLFLNKNCFTAKILSHALGLEFIVPRNSNIQKFKTLI